MDPIEIGNIANDFFAFDHIPSGVESAIGEGLDLAGNTVSKVSDMIASNWILWLSLAFGILTFSISIFRRLRKHK